jgi:hypothetical protein
MSGRVCTTRETPQNCEIHNLYRAAGISDPIFPSVQRERTREKTIITPKDKQNVSLGK